MDPNSKEAIVADLHQKLGMKTEMSKQYLAAMLELAVLFDKKQSDYGSSNISSTGELGVMVRTQDKVSRVRNLLMKELKGSADAGAENEPLEDSWKDMANYGVIGLLLRRGLWR
jgi:hypothetical protein